MNFAGIDVGSTMTKVVICDGRENVVAARLGATGPQHRELARGAMDEAIRQAGLTFDQLNFITATGYGRVNVPFAHKQITEIACHARGVRAVAPSARVVIDIGGQDSKAMKLGADGRVTSFVMNDKCAAGTGRFLEVIADTLGMTVSEMGEVSLQAASAVQISSICTVFAECEVTSRLAEGASVPEICAGIHEAIARRVVNMARTLGIAGDVVVTGGGAKHRGLVKAIEQKLGPVQTPPEPLITGALGAALMGKDLVRAGSAPAHGRTLERGTSRR